MAETILIVDDEPNILKVMRIALEREGYHALLAPSAADALRELGSRPIDAMVTDLKMPGQDGLELLTRARMADPALPVILMTAHGSVETAVEAMKQGAFDYLTKPIDNAALLSTLDKALNTRALRAADSSASGAPAEAGATQTVFIGRSRAVQQLVETAKRAAVVDSTILLIGETGTGKELIARMLHENSPRRAGPFQAVNCAALPANLIESELFGYEKGAFTGAGDSKPGRFELADGGTILLDEIGEMPLELQPKLLRVLQERRFERVGGIKSRVIDTRVVAATNRDLQQLIAEKRFREDLFYRLNVITLRLPPLRERKEDIHPLVEHFNAILAIRLRRPPRTFTSEAQEAFMRYDWPGNVRELENLVERMTVLEPDGEIGAAAVSRELAAAIRPLQSPTSIKEHVDATSEALEIQMIRKALGETDGNRTRAAGRLGISRRTLQLKMKKYGLQDRAGSGGAGETAESPSV